jgi:phospholipase C
MENHGYNEVVDHSNQPFTHWLTDHCGLAKNYHNVTHHSLPNYLSAVSGVLMNDWNAVNARLIENDCPLNACSVRGSTLFGQVKAKGLEWRSYEEAMEAPCQRQPGGTSNTLYQPKHNPASYYPNLKKDCQAWDLPMGSYAAGNLHDALLAGMLPAFTFLTPDMCHDTHDCWSEIGDQWLATWVTEIVKSKNYQRKDTVLFITWDEGEGGSTGARCVSSRAADCHVATIVVSPTTRADMHPDQAFSHYSLLRTTEELLGLKLLGEAAHAPSMRIAFGLGRS